MAGIHRWKDVRPLIEAAAVDDWSRPLSGAAELLTEQLRHGGVIPDGLLECAIGQREPDFLDAVLGNDQVLADPALLDQIAELALAGDIRPLVGPLLVRRAMVSRAEVRERLAETGHPRVADEAHVPGGTGWSYRLRRKVLAAAGPGEAVRQAWKLLGHKGWVSAADQLYALLVLHEHGERLAGVAADRLLPEVAEVLHPFDGGERLRAAAERAMGAEGLVAELHAPFPGHDVSLAAREPLDWAALTAAARENMFPKDAAAAVAAHPGCPDDLRDLLYTRHPAAVAERAAHLDLNLVTAPCPKRSRAKAVRTLIQRGLGQGIGGAALAMDGAPAVAVLEAMRARPGEPGAARAEWEAFAKVLAGLVAERLGDDVHAWRSARALLGGFAGTVPELLAEAAAVPHPSPAAEWPEAADHPLTSSPSSLSGARAAFVTLLDAAPDTAHAALLPHLDARTTHDLYRFCSWRHSWPGHAATTESASPARILAARPGLPVDAVERLLDVPDPEVLTTLFWHLATTGDQRARIMSTAAEPLLAQLDRLVSLPEHAQGWRLGDLCACPSPDLFLRALKEVFVLGRVPQLELFCHVWRTWGPGQVAAMLTRTPVTYSTYDGSRDEIRDLLALPGRAAALAELEARVAEGTSARGQAAMWRGRRDRAAMVKETHRWHWAELLEEHRREPFHSDLVGLLPRLPDCPDEFRREARTVLLSWEGKPYRQLMAGVPAAEVLAESDADHLDSMGREWLLQAIRRGRVTWAQALEHARPARAVLQQLGEDEQGRAALAVLMDGTLKGGADAWLLAVSMVPDFTGTVAELLRTAGLAAG
ncbi:hypothetical protein FXF51_55560 [Nonomuraea sp. PA05]|uniref:hypothetical protein n=1 Tax=Nonomuraea sp. PA05 TaxID=2604466 RepID=UPI0011D5595E|nr:hypothetical protein [Nonomuraea sp. PA05]TYB50616.1 hypothetical protein FXF51_55560 [Nonomuraea sp. PA05]